MKMKSKRIFVLALSAITLIVISFPRNAYAYWEENEKNWRYIDDSGYAKGWQDINGRWYYLEPETGIMKIGWFYDEEYNKWYYLNDDGAMDSSKTTSTYPIELSSVKEKIKQYTNEDVEYEATSQIDDNVFVCFKSKNDLTVKQYYYETSRGNIFEVKDGIFTEISTGEVINMFSEEQAVEVVHDYLSDNYKYIPKIIEVKADDGDSYFVHCYDTEGDASNSSWYHVNKTTREVTPEI